MVSSLPYFYQVDETIPYMALPWVNVLVLVMLVLVGTYVGWDPILAACLAAPCVLINAVLVVVWCYLRSEVRVPLVRKLQQAASSGTMSLVFEYSEEQWQAWVTRDWEERGAMRAAIRKWCWRFFLASPVWGLLTVVYLYIKNKAEGLNFFEWWGLMTVACAILACVTWVLLSLNDVAQLAQRRSKRHARRVIGAPGVGLVILGEFYSSRGDSWRWRCARKDDLVQIVVDDGPSFLVPMPQRGAEDVPVVEALGGPYRNVPEAQPQLPSALPATNLEEAILVADALRSA